MPVDEGLDLSPLDDIQQIVKTRPELTPEEQILADKLLPHVKALVKPEVRKEMEAELIKRQAAFESQLAEENKKAVLAAMEQWKKDQEPLKDADIATLLNQKYEQFEFTIKGRHSTKDFVLMELPQAVENKVLKLMQKKLIPLLKELIAAEFKLDLESSAVDKFESIIQGAPELLDIMVDIVVICLDPWGEDAKLDAEWVKYNMNAHRILAVLTAQIEVNKYRDFFFNGFRLTKNLKR